MESTLEERFKQAAEDAMRLPSRPDDATLLELYALYKQATSGDLRGRRPGVLSPVKRAKWDAWAELDGMAGSEAMRRYVARVEALKGGSDEEGGAA